MRPSKLSRTIEAAFPQPLPSDLLAPPTSSYDAWSEAMNCFRGRFWSEVSLDDWKRMSSPDSLKLCLTPKQFHYYLPSLLIETSDHPDYQMWGIQGLLPGNLKRKARGMWWTAYRDLFSSPQEDAAKWYLDWVAQDAKPGSAERMLAEEARATYWT